MGAGTGGQYRAQGTDTFGNPQAPQSGAAVYNADGQSVGTGNTSIRPGQSVATNDSSNSSGRPSAYDSPANQGTNQGSDQGLNQGSNQGSRSDTGYGSGTGSWTGSGTGTGPSLASVVPGTQAYKDSHLRDNDSRSGYGGAGSGNQGYGSNMGSGKHLHPLVQPAMTILRLVFAFKF